MGKPFDFASVPTDLRATPLDLGSAAVLGSCLSGHLVTSALRSNFGAIIHHIIINNGDGPPVEPHLPYNFQVVQLGLRSVMPEQITFKVDLSNSEQIEKMVAAAYALLDRAINNALLWSRTRGIPAFVCNFLVPQFAAFGRFQKRYDYSNPAYLVEKLNERLCKLVEDHDNAYLLDADRISSFLGRVNHQDDSIFQFSHASVIENRVFEADKLRIVPVDEPGPEQAQRLTVFCDAIWFEAIAMYRTLQQVDSVKMVVFDLDDTLWRGVAAERDEVDLEMVEGWPTGILEAMTYLRRRGVILSLLSKNDESKVTEIWRKLYGTRFDFDEIAIKRINWRPKIENMGEIIQAANVLPSSVVFVDDNPVERNAIRDAFPGIRCLGADPNTVRWVLLCSSETQVPVITDESRRRTEMVKAGIEREEMRAAVGHDDFLSNLDLKIRQEVVRSAEHPSFKRAFELVNKTNQYNTTGKRWQDSDFTAFFALGAVLYCYRAADKHSDYGLVAVAITLKAVIEQFVMSCRVVGLGVEQASVSAVVNELQKVGNKATRARWVATNANVPTIGLWKGLGASEDGESFIFAKPPAFPDHVTFSSDEPARPESDPTRPEGMYRRLVQRLRA